MIDYLIELDTSLFLRLNSFHSPFWDIFMMIFSGKFIWTGLYAALLYEIWRTFGWRSLILVFVATIAAVFVADQVTASILRPFFERLRPAHPENPISEMVHIVDGYRGGRYGFPSCHAANSFALASLMILIFKRLPFTLFIIGWALLNCYSRVYLGVHYPGDLLVGIIIGCLTGVLIYLPLRSALKWWAQDKNKGNLQRVQHARIGNLRFSYRPADVPIFVGLLTVGYIFACASSIFFQ